ncbi:MAG: MFS transporter, partial [Aeromonas sp.]
LFTRLRGLGWNIDIPSQFAASLFFMGLGMLVLPLGIHLAGPDGLVAFKWIAISYVLQSLGELLISPIGYAMIGKLAPARLQGLMMGCWMMVTGVASVLAGYLSGAMPQNLGSTPAATNPGYSSIFALLGWGSLAGALVLLLLVPRLRQLIAAKVAPQSPTPTLSI